MGFEKFIELKFKFSVKGPLNILCIWYCVLHLILTNDIKWMVGVAS